MSEETCEIEISYLAPNGKTFRAVYQCEQERTGLYMVSAAEKGFVTGEDPHTHDVLCIPWSRVLLMRVKVK